MDNPEIKFSDSFGATKVEVHLFEQATSNPYLSLFETSLANNGVTVIKSRFTRRFLSKPAEGKVIHFHWPSVFYAGERREEFSKRLSAFVEILSTARAAGWKILWTAHNVFPHDGCFRDLEHAALKQLLSRCDWVIAHCQQAASILAASTSFKLNISVIPHPNFINAYGLPPSKKAARAALGIEHNKRVLLSFGILRPYKGIENLVQSVNEIAAPDLLLVIAGLPQDSVYLERLCKLMSNGKYFRLFAQEVAPLLVPQLFSAADAVVLPYLAVTTSGVAILAQSMSRPVIAPRIGCLVETVVDGTGTLYDPLDPLALRRSVATFPYEISDRMGGRAYEIVSKHTWADAAQFTIEIYRRILRTNMDTNRPP
jgi:beta-1,4-mannosyltransferase